MPRAFEPYHESCMRCGCIFSFWTNFAVYKSDSAANVSWTVSCRSRQHVDLWNPQAMGLQGQFCGGDLMNQQSQVQSQAQTQAQLAALREQNTILNQQLASQAQSHIQHLQQLLPFHQSHVQSTSTSAHKRQCLNHQHRWHLSPHHRDPVYPSMQKRWCNRWRTRLSPACKRLWRRTKSATWANLLLPLNHQFKPLHLFQVILLHQMKFHHHHNTLTVALALAPTGTVGHRTNVQSLFHEVLVEPHHRDEHIVPLDHARHTGRRHSTSRDPSRRPSRATSVTLLSASPRRREVPPDHDDLDRDEPSHEPATTSPCIVGTSTLSSRSIIPQWVPPVWLPILWPAIHQQVEILEPMEGLSKISVSNPSIGLDWLSQSLLQTPQLLWIFLQVFHQTTHCILLRPFTSTSTQIRLNPISCLHQCRPPRTCSHQSSRWFERGMGSSYQACFESSRQDASCQWAQGWRTSSADHLHSTRWIRCCDGTAPSGRSQNSKWMYLERLSNCSSAPTSFRTTTSPLATSVNFLIRTCLHSSCHCQKSVDSRCHLLLTNNIITPGHSVTERPSKPLNWSSWKVRSDRPTGLTIRIHKSATYPPLGHFILAEKSPMRTKQFRPGRKRPSLIPWRKRAKANRTSPWAQCIEEPMSTSPFELVATKKPKSTWATKA